jgi:hypothetical protein
MFCSTFFAIHVCLAFLSFCDYGPEAPDRVTGRAMTLDLLLKTNLILLRITCIFI